MRKVIISDQLIQLTYQQILEHIRYGAFWGGGGETCFNMKLHKYANIKTVGNSPIWIISMNICMKYVCTYV